MHAAGLSLVRPAAASAPELKAPVTALSLRGLRRLKAVYNFRWTSQADPFRVHKTVDYLIPAFTLTAMTFYDLRSEPAGRLEGRRVIPARSRAHGRS
jgi:hypothetical protein